MLAYAILDHDFVPEGAQRSGAGRTPEMIQEWLHDAGLSRTITDIVEYRQTVEQTRAWLSIPVFSFPFTSMSYEERMDILAKAYRRQADKNQTSTAPWLLVTAASPAAASETPCAEPPHATL